MFHGFNDLEFVPLLARRGKINDIIWMVFIGLDSGCLGSVGLGADGVNEKLKLSVCSA